MSDLTRFGISAEEELLSSFDDLITRQGYVNRSEAVRDLMRDALVKSQLAEGSESAEVFGSLTIVYDHHHAELKDRMDNLQHEHHHLVISNTHVHINHNDCLEVIILRGQLKKVRLLAESILSLKGVKHGNLFFTLPAEKITNPIIEHRH